MLEILDEIVMWSRGPGSTLSVAVAGLGAEDVPVTVWGRVAVAVQACVDWLHDPSAGEIVKPVPLVTSPRLLPYLSVPEAVYVCDPPAVMVAEPGAMVSEAMGPGVTVKDAVAVLEPSVAVTVCGPATVAVQFATVQDAAGPVVDVVAPVALPRSFPYWSKPSVA